MNRKEKLIHELTSRDGEEWATVATAALGKKEVRPGREGGALASTSVGDLLRTYRIRLDRCTETDAEVYGMRELLDSLSMLPVEDAVAVEPFLGDTVSVNAFWDSEMTLIGCVSVMNFDSGRGRENLEFARGNKG